MVIFAIISYSLLWLVLFLSAVQFLLAWLNDRPNDNLRDFAAKLDGYFRDCLDFLGYATDTVPFPFSPFPDRDDGAGAKPAAKRTRQAKKSKPSPTPEPESRDTDNAPDTSDTD
jgi:hypothetical protein